MLEENCDGTFLGAYTREKKYGIIQTNKQHDPDPAVWHCLALRLRLSENIFDDPLACFIIVACSVAALPAPIRPLANAFSPGIYPLLR